MINSGHGVGWTSMLIKPIYVIAKGALTLRDTCLFFGGPAEMAVHAPCGFAIFLKVGHCGKHWAHLRSVHILCFLLTYLGGLHIDGLFNSKSF